MTRPRDNGSGLCLRPEGAQPVGPQSGAEGNRPNFISHLLFLLKHHKARKRLEQIVTRNRASFATQDYAKRRAAALKARARKRQHSLFDEVAA